MKDELKSERPDSSAAQPEFTLSRLIGSKRFSWVEKCVLRAVLDEEKTYTIAGATAAIAEFMKKEVV